MEFVLSTKNDKCVRHLQILTAVMFYVSYLELGWLNFGHAPYYTFSSIVNLDGKDPFVLNLSGTG